MPKIYSAFAVANLHFLLITCSSALRHRRVAAIENATTILQERSNDTLGQMSRRLRRLKIYYINLNGSPERAECLNEQLTGLVDKAQMYGMALNVERFAATSFVACHDTESCKKEIPECFPSGLGFAGHGIDSGVDKKLQEGMVRGVFGDYCSHLQVLRRISQELDSFDNFLVLEDDVLVDEGILQSLMNLFSNFHDFWSLVAIDTWTGPPRPVPLGDEIPDDITLGLELRSLSPTEATYWGSHAWLFNSAHVPQFLRYTERLPTMNTDWLTKVPRPLHMGMWAFNPGQLQQLPRLRDAGLGNATKAPISCRDVSHSDIVHDVPEEPERPPAALSLAATTRRTVVDREAATTRRTVVDREVLIFGMPGSGVEKVRSLIAASLEEPLNTTFCKRDMGGFCGGVPHNVSAAYWSDLVQYRNQISAPLDQATAVVVVRHPFSIIEEAFHDNIQLSCEDGGCKAKCESLPHNQSWWTQKACIWNFQMDLYNQIKSSGPFARTVFLRYEDVIEDPDIVASKIAEAVGSHVKNSHFEDKTRGVGMFLQENTSTDVLNTLTFRGDAQCKNLEVMCHSLSRARLWQYGYHGCDMYTTVFATRAWEDIGVAPEFFNNCSEFFDHPLYK